MRILAPGLVLVLTGGSVIGQGRAIPLNQVTSPPQLGLLLTAAVPGSVRAGAPLPVAVTVVNTGPASARLFVEHAHPVPFDVAVTTPDGRPVPLTGRGREVLEPLFPLPADGINFAVRVGGQHKLSVPDLGEFFDLTAPGEYHLTVSRGVDLGPGLGNGVMLLAPAVAFRVTRP